MALLFLLISHSFLSSASIFKDVDCATRPGPYSNPKSGVSIATCEYDEVMVSCGVEGTRNIGGAFQMIDDGKEKPDKSDKEGDKKPIGLDEKGKGSKTPQDQCIAMSLETLHKDPCYKNLGKPCDSVPCKDRKGISPCACVSGKNKDGDSCEPAKPAKPAKPEKPSEDDACAGGTEIEQMNCRRRRRLMEGTCIELGEGGECVDACVSGLDSKGDKCISEGPCGSRDSKGKCTEICPSSGKNSKGESCDLCPSGKDRDGNECVTECLTRDGKKCDEAPCKDRKNLGLSPCECIGGKNKDGGKCEVEPAPVRAMARCCAFPSYAVRDVFTVESKPTSNDAIQAKCPYKSYMTGCQVRFDSGSMVNAIDGTWYGDQGTPPSLDSYFSPSENICNALAVSPKSSVIAQATCLEINYKKYRYECESATSLDSGKTLSCEEEYHLVGCNADSTSPNQLSSYFIQPTESDDKCITKDGKPCDSIPCGLKTAYGLSPCECRNGINRDGEPCLEPCTTGEKERRDGTPCQDEGQIITTTTREPERRRNLLEKGGWKEKEEREDVCYVQQKNGKDLFASAICCRLERLTDDPTIDPTVDPTSDPTADPTADPTRDPTADPTMDPTMNPLAPEGSFESSATIPIEVADGVIEFEFGAPSRRRMQEETDPTQVVTIPLSPTQANWTIQTLDTSALIYGTAVSDGVRTVTYTPDERATAACEELFRTISASVDSDDSFPLTPDEVTTGFIGDGPPPASGGDFTLTVTIVCPASEFGSVSASSDNDNAMWEVEHEDHYSNFPLVENAHDHEQGLEETETATKTEVIEISVGKTTMAAMWVILGLCLVGVGAACFVRMGKREASGHVENTQLPPL